MLNIILAVIGSSSITSFIIFLINRRDKKKAKNSEVLQELKRLNNRILKSEKDNVRTQLLVLMSNYADNKEEILRCAEHYFVDLNGNWYATSLFEKWLITNDLDIPSWIK